MEKQKSEDKPQKKSWFQGLQSEFEKIVWTDPSHTGKADCCGRDHHDHPGSGYQCNGFRNSGMH